MELSTYFDQDYIDSLQSALDEDLAYDRDHEVNDVLRDEILIRLNDLDTYGSSDYSQINPENFKPRAANIFLYVLKLCREDEKSFRPDLESNLTFGDILRISWSNILYLYYTGYKPQNDADFVNQIWAPDQPYHAIKDINRRRRLVVQMHRIMNPPKPIKSDHHLGGRKSLKNTILYLKTKTKNKTKKR
jgi:hypothetical protein